MKNNKYPIEFVVPHEHPMILIDQLLQYDHSKAICQVSINEKSNFYSQKLKSVPSYVAIEYMAQSIAAFANANNKDQGLSVAIGFLVSSRKFKLMQPAFNLGDKLIITVEQLYIEESGLAAFDCIAELNDSVVATAKINIFQPQNPEEFLAEQN
jgi:predicted hotdog family 3-hydroxylacyl-ACP dehydratase